MQLIVHGDRRAGVRAVRTRREKAERDSRKRTAVEHWNVDWGDLSPLLIWLREAVAMICRWVWGALLARNWKLETGD